jgi:hypothetical protein
MKELNDISSKNPFKVPDNYFEDVNSRIIASTAGNNTRVKERSIFSRLKPYLAVAASVALLIMLSYTVIHIVSSGSKKLAVPEITLSEFTDNYLDEIDIMTLEDKAGYIEPEQALTNLNSKEIIDYLLFENIDINDLQEQF